MLEKEELKELTDITKIDKTSPIEYYEYYQRLMPFYLEWYNPTISNEPNLGYRPIAIGRNISWWIEKNEIVRNCYVKECKNKTESCHIKLSQYYNDKLSCWECSENKNNDKKKKRALISPWERYYNMHDRILWNIERVKSSHILKTCRSLYWHNSIRDKSLLNKPTDKSWNETIASNFTLDIDIHNKNTKNIWDSDILDKLYPMLCTVADDLENNDIGYKIMSSGNGIYFITERIIYDLDKEGNEDREVFWNKISFGWREYINNYLKPKVDNYKVFDLDGEEPYTMKFYKSPFSLHQRLGVSAIPINIDMINGIKSEEFVEMSNPLYVVDNWKKLVNAW